MFEDVAARIRVTVRQDTLQALYQLGAVRPDHEAEDLAAALSRLAAAAVRHGLQLDH